MKTIISVLAVTALLSSPVFADDHGHNGGMDKSDMTAGGMMMSHEQMVTMHKHMQKMTDIMKKIKTETDSEKRQKLMQQHINDMQEGMKMRMGDMSMDMKTQSKMGDKDMMKRMTMMEQRMGMLQMMMGQMMDHELEAKKVPEHK